MMQIFNSVLRFFGVFLLLVAAFGCASKRIEAPEASKEVKGIRGVNWYQAARLGDIDVMVSIVKSGSYKWDGADVNGVTGLMVAARYGQVELMKRLIQEVPSLEHIDRRDIDNQSALMYAVLGVAKEADKQKCVDLLIESGADPFLIDRFGFQIVRGMIDMGMLDSIRKIKFTSSPSARQCDRGAPKPGEPSLSRYARKADETKIAEFLELQGCW